MGSPLPLQCYKTAMRNEAIRLVVQLDDAHDRQLVVFNLCVANARYFGGGMKIAWMRNADGKFDVVGVGDLSALKLFTSAPRVHRVYIFPCRKSATLSPVRFVRPADRSIEVALEIDGELPGDFPPPFKSFPKPYARQ